MACRPAADRPLIRSYGAPSPPGGEADVRPLPAMLTASRLLPTRGEKVPEGRMRGGAQKGSPGTEGGCR